MLIGGGGVVGLDMDFDVDGVELGVCYCGVLVIGDFLWFCCCYWV